MRKKLFSGLTSALVVTGTSLVPASRAEQVPTAAHRTAVLNAQAIASANLSQPDTDVLKVGSTLESQGNRVATPVLARVQRHEYQGREAATLYVRNLPILTFLGDRLSPAQEERKLPSPSLDLARRESAPSSALLRASTVAARLNDRLDSGSLEGTDIGVRWDARQRSHSIQADGESLLSLDRNTVIPGVTASGNKALLVANRLRRTLGASPLDDASQALGSFLGQVVATASGWASWYGPGFHGNRTANGERFNMNDLTAAHRTLPFGTRVRVTNVANGSSVVVRINDRGPFHGNRVMDLSRGAASVIGLTASGVGRIRMEILDGRQQTAMNY